MKLAIANEHAGYHLKRDVVQYLNKAGVDIQDLGIQSDQPADYPFIAASMSERVIKGEFDCGILICGTGIGMSIAAGKVPGIRAALCTDPFMAKMAKEHNDANILCLGSWITGTKLSYAIIDAYLKSEFTEGRHKRRLDQIKELENKYGSGDADKKAGNIIR